MDARRGRRHGRHSPRTRPALPRDSAIDRRPLLVGSSSSRVRVRRRRVAPLHDVCGMRAGTRRHLSLPPRRTFPLYAAQPAAVPRELWRRGGARCGSPQCRRRQYASLRRRRRRRNASRRSRVQLRRGCLRLRVGPSRLLARGLVGRARPSPTEERPPTVRCSALLPGIHAKRGSSATTTPRVAQRRRSGPQ